MPEVHVFISCGRFRSFEQLRAFIDPEYTEDGDAVPSAFAREVGLSRYEPDCIEAEHVGTPTSVNSLLEGASYAEDWLWRADGSKQADAAICVFPPNHMRSPRACSLEYLGAFEYRDGRRSGGESVTIS